MVKKVGRRSKETLTEAVRRTQREMKAPIDTQESLRILIMEMRYSFEVKKHLNGLIDEMIKKTHTWRQRREFRKLATTTERMEKFKNHVANCGPCRSSLKDSILINQKLLAGLQLLFPNRSRLT